MKVLDTCFLLHLHREWAGKRPGPASAYLESHRDEEFTLSVIAALEFLEGYERAADGERFLAPFPQLPVTAEVARTGARIRRDLRQRGEMIGDFDILIAATAMEAGLTLVTDNGRDFARIGGLSVEGYR